MINDFEDFCTWMYMVTDDIWLKIAPLFKRPGPRPECPDSELLAMGGTWGSIVAGRPTDHAERREIRMRRRAEQCRQWR